MAYIYKIENQINHKVYIGKTEYDPQKRWKQHQNESQKIRSQNRALYRAINKYGIENFIFEVIKETSSPNEDEIKTIIEYDSFHNGYNETLGGDGRAYLELPEQEICRFYLKRKSIKATAEYFKHDRLTIKKILYKNNIVIESNSALKKSVAKIDKNTGEVLEIYSSVSEAEKLNESTGGHIGQVCLGKRKTAGGFKWKYCSDI